MCAPSCSGRTVKHRMVELEYRKMDLEKMRNVIRDMETFRQSLRLLADEVLKKNGGELRLPGDEYIYLWQFYDALEHKANDRLVDMVATYGMAKLAREVLGEEKT